MEERTLTPVQIGVKYGIILGLVGSAYSLLLNITRLAVDTPSLGWLSIIISIVLLVIAMREFRTANGDSMSLGEGFKVGAMASLIQSVIASVFGYVYMKFIDPQFLEVMKDKQVEQFEKQGMSDEQIESAVAMSGSMMNPEVITVMGFVMAVLGGLLISLIIAAIMKRDRQMM